MARRSRKLSATHKFFIISGTLIVMEIVYLGIFGGDQAPLTPREAIEVAVEQQKDLPAERKTILRIQLALRDYKQKNSKYPGTLDELVPGYFDQVPYDPRTSRPFRYQITNNRYILGDPPPKKDDGAVGPDGGTKINPVVLATLESETPKASFVYDPTGKRDPFKPFDFSAVGTGIDPKNPLTGYDIGQLRLSSVLAGFEEPIAIVENSAGKGFTVRKGTKVGRYSGEVVDIQPDKIVILEEITDFTGQKKSVSHELKLRTKDQDGSQDSQ